MDIVGRKYVHKYKLIVNKTFYKILQNICIIDKNCMYTYSYNLVLFYTYFTLFIFKICAI